MRGLDTLSVRRINGVMNELRDVRELPQQLLWVSRTPRTPSTDAEVQANYQGNVVIADIVGDDAVAPVRHTGQLSTERTVIPNLKQGRLFTQEFLATLNRINAGGGIPDDQGYISDYINREVDAVLLSLRHREEQLIMASLLDDLDYNLLGVKFDNVSWGTPSDLKVTPSTPWTTAASATPITDILTVKQLALEKYGVMLDRVTMSSTAFRQMIATTEFKNQAQLFNQYSFPANTFPSQNLSVMRVLAGQILDMEVEVYDARYWTETNAGVVASSPFLPANKVILTSKADDGNRQVRDLADTVTIETQVASIAGGAVAMVGNFDGPSRGPVAYASPSVDLNPPNFTLWGVERVFPRKRMKASNAVLTVAA